ncbi:hypothetical protein ATKI12_8993 [Kitasatospora sp. Ki12]
MFGGDPFGRRRRSALDPMTISGRRPGSRINSVETGPALPVASPRDGT